MYNYRIVCIVVAVAFSFELRGQAARTSFSSFGMGTPYGGMLVNNQAMGGIGVSNPDEHHLSTLNPALLIFNDKTIIEAGLIFEQRTIRNAELSERATDANFNYLALAFPIKLLRWTTSIGIMPYTHVNYKVNYQAEIEGSDQSAQIEESGQGGINEFYWSHGVALYKNLSLGVKGRYLFGTTVNAYASSMKEAGYTVTIHDKQAFSGVGFSVGLSFHLDSLLRKKKYQFNAGFSYDFAANVKTSFQKSYTKVLTRIVTITDPTVILNDVSRTTFIPQSMLGGVSFGKTGQWIVGVDFAFHDFSQYRDYNGNRGGAEDGWRLSAGGKIVPNFRTEKRYLNKIAYQMGFTIEKNTYLVNERLLNDYAFHFGLTLPIWNLSSITLAMKVGKQGDIQKNTIEEGYFKVYCSISFRDKWFIKRKFD